MKPISPSTERKFMRRITSVARSNGSGLVDVRGDALGDLRARPDFLPVLNYLNAKGLLKTHCFDDEIWHVSLTAKGKTYFEDARDASRDRRWTRGLAIAAIAISIAALCVSALSLWLQWISR